MSSRISSALALIFVAACGRENTAHSAAEGLAIECALHGASDFARDCTAERIRHGRSRQLVVRHPDGGFRRFDNSPRGLVAADGAQKAEVAQAGGIFAIAVGGDRYRLPAAMLDHGN